MKKVLSVLAVFALTASVSFAQIKVGGGLSYRSKAGLNNGLYEEYGEYGKLGVNLKGIAEIKEKLYFTSSIAYFSKSTYNSPSISDDETSREISITPIVINVDANYNFFNEENNRIYGIIGADYTILFKNSNNTEFRQGLNLGAGYEHGINDRISLFGEAKYCVRYTQATIEMGVLIAP